MNYFLSSLDGETSGRFQNISTNFDHILKGGTVLHRSICDVFWGLGDRSYTIMIQYDYQMKD